MNVPFFELSTALIVEDNPADADYVRALLEGWSFSMGSLVSVDTLREAMHLVQQHPPDVVLLDLRLPDAEGVQCVRSLASVADNLPIVVLTGMDDDALGLECIAEGAQDFVSKSNLAGDLLRRTVAYAVTRVRERAARIHAAALESQLAAIVEASSDGIVGMTRDGRVRLWNAAAGRIFGVARDEVTGQRLLAHIEQDAAVEGAPRDLFLSGGTAELVWSAPEGERKVLRFVVSPVPSDGADDAVEVALVVHDVTENRRLLDELRTRNEELKEGQVKLRALAQRVDQSLEAQRAHISREVHDQLGQLLTGIKLDLRWSSRRLERDPPEIETVLTRLAEAQGLVDSTIETVQRIAIELRPRALDSLGLPEALRDEVRRFSARTGTRADVHVVGSPVPSGHVATALFRVSQELLTNVSRHAHAQFVELNLTQLDGAIKLEVFDDGVGFAQARNTGRQGLGLLGISERVQALGGTVEVKSQPGVGTRASVIVPLSRESDMVPS